MLGVFFENDEWFVEAKHFVGHTNKEQEDYLKQYCDSDWTNSGQSFSGPCKVTTATDCNPGSSDAMRKALITIALFQIFSTPSAHADDKTPPSIIKFQESSREKMIEESKKFGDPSKPAELNFKSLASHITSLQGSKKQEDHVLSERKLASQKETSIDPIGPILAAEMGCTIVIADVSGIMGRDSGKMSGYRTVMECENYMLDIQENDYPQTKTQRVFTFIPAEATNVDLGPGRAIARYFTHPQSGLMATFGWTNDKQEVLVQAISDPQSDALSWNLKMTDVARRVVAARNSQ